MPIVNTSAVEKAKAVYIVWSTTTTATSTLSPTELAAGALVAQQLLNRTSITYPMPDAVSIQNEISSACPAGCGQIGFGCQACAPGTYSSNIDLDCIPCKPNTYAAMYAQPACQLCPDGASCPDPSSIPFALPGFYRFDERLFNSTYQKGIRSQICASANISAAGPPSVILTGLPSGGGSADLIYFVQCDPSSLCLGNNTCVGTNRGILCGSCPPGETRYGLQPGKALCTPCAAGNSGAYIGLAGAWLYAMLWAFGISRSVQATYKDSRATAVPLLKIVQYTLQGYSIILIFTTLDRANTIATVVPALLGNLLIRPAQLIPAECFFATPDKDKSKMALFIIRSQIQTTVVLVIFGYIVITGIFIIRIVLLQLWALKLSASTGPTRARAGVGARSITASSQGTRTVSQYSLATTRYGGGISETEEGEESRPMTGRRMLPSGVSLSVSVMRGMKRLFQNVGMQQKKEKERLFKMQSFLRPAANEALTDFIRFILSWTIVVYPGLMFTSAQAMNCSLTSEGFDQPRLNAQYEVKCQDPEFLSTVYYPCTCLLLGLGFAIPTLFAVIYYVNAVDSDTLQCRARYGVLFLGHRLGYGYWDMVWAIRMFLFNILPVPIATTAVPTIFMIVECIMLILVMSVRPFLMQDHALLTRAYTLSALTNMALLVCLFYGSSSFNDDVKVLIASVAAVLYTGMLFCFAYFFCLSRMIIPLKIAQSTGKDLNRFKKLIINGVKPFLGLNQASFLQPDSKDKKAAKEMAIRTGGLNRSEKSHFIQGVQVVMAAYMDTTESFRIHEVGEALRVAFSRASGGRVAQNLATEQFQEDTLGWTPFGKLHEINARRRRKKRKDKNDKEDEQMAQSQLLGRQREKTRLGLHATASTEEVENVKKAQRARQTILMEELFTVLQDVEMDVMDGRPDLRRPGPKKALVVAEEDGSEKEAEKQKKEEVVEEGKGTTKKEEEENQKYGKEVKGAEEDLASPAASPRSGRSSVSVSPRFARMRTKMMISASLSQSRAIPRSEGDAPSKPEISDSDLFIGDNYTERTTQAQKLRQLIRQKIAEKADLERRWKEKLLERKRNTAPESARSVPDVEALLMPRTIGSEEPPDDEEEEPGMPDLEELLGAPDAPEPQEPPERADTSDSYTKPRTTPVVPPLQLGGINESPKSRRQRPLSAHEAFYQQAGTIIGRSSSRDSGSGKSPRVSLH